MFVLSNSIFNFLKQGSVIFVSLTLNIFKLVNFINSVKHTSVKFV